MDIRTKGSSTTNRRRKLWINRVRGQQDIQASDREEAALEGHMTEIIKMMLNIHQGKQKIRRKTSQEKDYNRGEPGSQDKRTKSNTRGEWKKRGKPNVNKKKKKDMEEKKRKGKI